jgi:hypothetical protein
VRPRRAITLAVAAAALALAAPATSSAITLGSPRVAHDSNAGLFCGGFPDCAFVQTSLQGAITKAPKSGRIKSWRVHLQDPGTLQLIVFRQRGNGTYRAVNAQPPKTTMTAGVKGFKSNLKIAKGEFVGVNLLDEDIGIRTLNATGTVQIFQSSFAVGDIVPPDETDTVDELLFNAKLKT